MTATTEPLAGTTVEDLIPRDRWGRPQIIAPDGSGKLVSYTRCTTFVKSLGGDSNALVLWAQRLTALGLIARQDLRMAVATAGDGTTDESKKKLNKLVEQAKEAGGGSAAATTGTALHAATELVDNGEDYSRLPQEFHADLAAYAKATAHLETVQVETFGVHDGLKIGGTWDRIYRYQGKLFIGDVKTGRVDDFTAGSIAMQLSVYAHCHQYNPTTGARTPLGVETDKAIVVHLPAGTGTATLKWIDIRAGWDAVQVAKQVRDWLAYGKAKNLIQELVPEQPALLSAPVATAADMFQVPAERALLSALHEAPTVDELVKLWQDFHTIWTPEHTAAANARKAQLA